MAVMIRDVLNLDIMKEFKVVAGNGGLDRTLLGTEILDFEFVEEVETYRNKKFDGNSLMLSSLLFAKDRPELVLDSIKKLICLNVQCLAYKPVFFKELPKEALDYADEMNFPILEFGRDEYFEDILFDIKKLIEKDDAIGEAEPLIDAMIQESVTEEEVAESREKMNSLLRPYIMAVYLRCAEFSAERVSALIKRSCPDNKLKSKTFVGKHRENMVIILSQDEDSPSRFKALLDDVLIAYGLAGKSVTMGVSPVRNKENQFDRCIREAYWAEKVAEIENTDVKLYRSMGIYKLITASIHKSSTISYMEEYLAPIFEEEGSDGELFHTAVEYVMARGDVVTTAERLYCHKNTIRYRIGKLQEKLDPDANEKEFYENLSVAVKIYLLKHFEIMSE